MGHGVPIVMNVEATRTRNCDRPGMGEHREEESTGEEGSGGAGHWIGQKRRQRGNMARAHTKVSGLKSSIFVPHQELQQSHVNSSSRDTKKKKKETKREGHTPEADADCILPGWCWTRRGGREEARRLQRTHNNDAQREEDTHCIAHEEEKPWKQNTRARARSKKGMEKEKKRKWKG